jgi:hypothetical protein
MPSAVIAAAGAFARQPPVLGIDRAEQFVAEVGVKQQQAPERAGLGKPAHLLERGLVAALVTDAEHEPGGRAGGEHALGAGGAKRQRLFAEHLLAGRDCGQNLRLVLRMRGDDGDRVEVAPRQQRVVALNEIEPKLAGERRRSGCVDVAPGHDLEARAPR